MISEEQLMAYADGELDAAERAEVEAALATDADLRARLKAHQDLQAKLSGAFDGALTEPVPARLQAAFAGPAGAQVVDLSARRAAKWSGREWGAMAASLAAGFVLAFGVFRADPMIAVDDGGMRARGALARALETQLAANDAGAVRIGLSFRAQDGDYCRTFSFGETAGLACRDGGGWDVAMTSAQDTGGDVRMASAPAEILAAVDAMIAGEPLDADAEAAARDAGWR